MRNIIKEYFDYDYFQSFDNDNICSKILNLLKTGKYNSLHDIIEIIRDSLSFDQMIMK